MHFNTQIAAQYVTALPLLEAWFCDPTNEKTNIGVNAAGIPPDRISFPHALAAATDTVAAFPP